MKPASTARLTDATPAEAPSSVAKACRILRALGELKHPRLTDIAQAADLDKATVLRLLEALTREGFARRDEHTKLYSAGPELQLAGASALTHADPRAAARPSLLRLASQFADTALLSIPSGAESLCLDLVLGDYPIRANYLEVGSRRPLGVGAGSLALLAWLPDAEREAVLDVVAEMLQRQQRAPRIDRALLQDRAAQARERGYVVLLDLVVERMGGVGVPVLGPDGRPVGALSIAALTDRITNREADLAGALQREAALCRAHWPGLSRGTA
jgi:DNA-binding IclR family transcriptional regulator